MANKGKSLSDKDGSEYLKERFSQSQAVFKSQILSTSGGLPHDGEEGAARENVWIEILRRHLPNKYSIESGFAIDSLGKVSKQLDIVIYDAIHTLKIPVDGKNFLIPVEAMHAVLEVKPQINSPNLNDAFEKIESVRSLSVTSAPIVDKGQIRPARTPFKIIGGLLCDSSSYSTPFGTALQSKWLKANENQSLDFVVSASDGFCEKCESSGGILVSDNSGDVINWILRLFSRLQSQGTAPKIDIEKYIATASERITK